MSDIICARCGEPWDSTGGLHFSHSELSEDEYHDLITGYKCPCCEANLANTAYQELKKVWALEGWQVSIEHFAEGRDEYMYVLNDVRPRCETEQLD